MKLPAALLDSLEGVEGFDKDEFEAIHESGIQVTSIRLNPYKQANSLKSYYSQEVPWCKNAFYLNERPSFTLDPSFHGGGYYVQEASSMFIWYILEQLIGKETKGKKVLDLCAAPGGKSTLLATYFTDGLVVANEVIKSRSTILVENTIKWGLPNIVVTNNDPSHFNKLLGFFDIILVDAPCSGSGLFRKDPSAVEEWSEENVLHCSHRQEKILADILQSLKEDGILIYSTCSYSLAEDEQIADWLVQKMEMQSLEINLPLDHKIVASESPTTNSVGYRFYPNLISGEGFYIAAFKKNEMVLMNKYKETILAKPNKIELAQINQFYTLPLEYQAFKQNDAIRVIPESWYFALMQLASVLYIKKAGIEIGTIKGKDVIPSHELAVSVMDKSTFKSVELNKDESLQYLRKKEMQIASTIGWSLVSYQGVYLGWMKGLQNRINNYYPAEWRILKD